MLDNAAVRRANIVAFVYSTAFVAMEASLTFLAAERFNYTTMQNTYLMVFLGLVAIFTQGYLVRKMLKTMEETRVLALGPILSVFRASGRDRPGRASLGPLPGAGWSSPRARASSIPRPRA